MAKRVIKKRDKKESTMEQIYLKDVLKKDTKLAVSHHHQRWLNRDLAVVIFILRFSFVSQKFIANTLNYDPASDTEVGSEINTDNSPLISTSSGSFQVAPVELIEQTSEQVDVSLIDSQEIEDDPELTFYFAEPNDKER